MTSKQKPSLVKTIGLHILSALLILAFLGAGGMKLAGAEQLAANFARFGLPRWFMYVTGAIEVVAALLLIMPRARFFGAALLVPTMIGATAAHLSVSDPVGQTMPGVVLLAMSALAAFAYRDTARALLDRATNGTTTPSSATT